MARNFNGTSDKITIPATVPHLTAAVQCCSVWIYPTGFPAGNTSGHGGIIFNSASGQSCFLYLVDTGALAVSGQVGAIGSSAGVITLNKWYHLAVNMPGGAGGAIYCNRASVASGALTGWTGTNVFNLVFGNDTNYSPRFFQGYMRDVAMWTNINLTTDEIGELYSGVRPNNIRPTNLVGHWPLKGRDPYEPDLTQFSTLNKGVLTGTSWAPDPPFLQEPLDKALRDCLLYIPPSLHQRHFRFRTDTDAVDATPTWGANEDSNMGL